MANINSERIRILVWQFIAFSNDVAHTNSQLNYLITDKLGYNDHGYNELTVITNKIDLLVWFSIIYQWNFMVITTKITKITNKISEIYTIVWGIYEINEVLIKKWPSFSFFN